jgi:hypothetical protein
MAGKKSEDANFKETNLRLKRDFFCCTEKLQIKEIMRSKYLRPLTPFGVEMMVECMRRIASADNFPLTVMQIPAEDIAPPQAAQIEVRYIVLDGGHRLAALDRLWGEAAADEKPHYSTVMCLVYKTMPDELQVAMMESMYFPHLKPCCVSSFCLRDAYGCVCVCCAPFLRRCSASSDGRSRDSGQLVQQIADF